jgi:hypothetical protein
MLEWISIVLSAAALLVSQWAFRTADQTRADNSEFMSKLRKKLGSDGL